MYGQQSFKAVHKMVHLVKFAIGKGCLIFFQVLTLRYLVLQDKKYPMVPAYLATQQQNKLNIQFPACANVGVLLSLEILPQTVACFDQVTLFSDFNSLFELLGPGFAPDSSNAFYILE